MRTFYYSTLIIGQIVAIGASIYAFYYGQIWILLSLLIYIALTWTMWQSRRYEWLDFNLWLRYGAENSDHRRAGFSGKFNEAACYVERLLLITQQQQQQRTHQLELLLNAIQEIPNGIMLLDELMRIEWMNRKAAQYLGLDPSIDRLQYLSNLVRLPELVAYLDEKEHNAPLLLQLTPQRKLSLQLFPYVDGYSIMLLKDVTRMERIEKIRRDFVANVSHELRTPLTVVSGFIETLQELPVTASERKHYLDLMQQQTERMQLLVRDLLTLANLEDSIEPRESEWISLDSIMQQVQTTTQELSGGKHEISFNIDVDAEIYGSLSELISALTNIATNAVRYTPAGGSISVNSKLTNNGELILSVTDTGYGIPAQHLNRLTERFYRVDRSRSRETGGTGLGLSIVKHVLIRHGGHLTIDSKEGRGSTFSLHYPAKRVRVKSTPAAEV